MPKILFLTAYPEEDASCRYRVHQFAPFLEQAGYPCTIAPFASPRLFQSLSLRGGIAAKMLEMLRCSLRRLALLLDLEQYDFVVIHREAFPFFAPVVEKFVLRRARRVNPRAKVIFSFDDAIYAGHQDVSGLSHPLLYRWKHGRGYDEVIRGCDHVIAGNRILAAYASRLNGAVTVVPTVVDCEKYRQRSVSSTQIHPITIGWMGSLTTAPYLRIAEPALLEIARKHGDGVRFRFVGCAEYKLSLGNFTSVPFRLETEIEELQTFDIGIMPMPDNTWTRGKCAFKAIQYMASGVATVASPVGITPDVIRHGSTGLLASTDEEWFSAIEQLINDAALRSRIASEARQSVERSFSLQTWAPRLVALFDQLAGKTCILEQDTIAA